MLPDSHLLVIQLHAKAMMQALFGQKKKSGNKFTIRGQLNEKLRIE